MNNTNILLTEKCYHNEATICQKFQLDLEEKQRLIIKAEPQYENADSIGQYMQNGHKEVHEQEQTMVDEHKEKLFFEVGEIVAQSHRFGTHEYSVQNQEDQLHFPHTDFTKTEPFRCEENINDERPIKRIFFTCAQGESGRQSPTVQMTGIQTKTEDFDEGVGDEKQHMQEYWEVSPATEEVPVHNIKDGLERVEIKIISNIEIKEETADHNNDFSTHAGVSDDASHHRLSDVSLDLNHGIQHKLQEHSNSCSYTSGKSRLHSTNGQSVATDGDVTLYSGTPTGSPHVDNVGPEKPYQCLICHDNFEEINMLQKHMAAHLDKKPHQCTMCDKKFKRIGFLLKHMRTHTGEEPYQCPSCDKKFTAIGCLRNHIRIHKSENEHTSSDKAFEMNRYIESQVTAPQTIKLYTCTICDKVYDRIGHLKVHMRSHTGEKPFTCETCGKSFSRKKALQSHILIHTGEKPYHCAVCKKGFREYTNLARHMRTHTGEKPFQCTTCDRRFGRLSHLKSHMRTHTGEKPFQCTTCDRTFRFHCQLKSHLRVHTGEKPYHCTVCDGMFRFHWEFKTHQRIHRVKKQHQCAICSQNFTDIESLNNHIRVHAQESQYQCTICNKKFTNIRTFKKHTVDHTGEKPYQCKSCDKVCRDTNQLKRHMRTHTGEKSHRCNSCEKWFAEMGQLKRHKKTHTSKEIYTCSSCDKRFGDRHNLKKHMSRHTCCKPEAKYCTMSDNDETGLLQGNKWSTDAEVKDEDESPIPNIQGGMGASSTDEGQVSVVVGGDNVENDCISLSNTQVKKEKDQERIPDAELIQNIEKVSVVSAAAEINNLQDENRELIDNQGRLIIEVKKEKVDDDLDKFQCVDTLVHHTLSAGTLGKDDMPGRTLDAITGGALDTITERTLQHNTEGTRFQCGIADSYIPDKDAVLPARESAEELNKEPSNTETNVEPTWDKTYTEICHTSNDEGTGTFEMPYQCASCEKRFKHADELKRHSLTHTDEKPCQCSTCGKRFNEVKHLNNHMLIHADQNQFQCFTCDKSFSRISSLKRHMIIHTDENSKPFQCTICHKKFVRIDYLKRHIKVHTGEKPYQCATCHRKFTEVRDLNSHLRTHTGEKPYQCTECNDRFSWLTTLNYHMRTHTGDKPYPCSACDKRFKTSGQLKKHTRTHSREKLYHIRQKVWRGEQSE